MATLIDFKVNTPIYNEVEQYEVVEYEVEPLHIEAYPDNGTNFKKYDFVQIEDIIAKNQSKIDSLNFEIDCLTNHADKVDYAMAIGSGVLTGLLDAFWVGEFNFDAYKANAHKHVNQFIEKYAKIRGYKDNGKGLKGAIEFLEKKFPVAQDNVWKASGISSTHLHHLEDLAHHPTLIGLFASVAVQLFNISFFSDKKGKFHIEITDTSFKDIAITWCPLLISGVLKWMIYLAESKELLNSDSDIPKPIINLIKKLSSVPAIIGVLKIVDNWSGHLVSDMGGSKNTPDGGKGIPGVFLSLLKEISSLPVIKDTALPQIVSDWYSKDKIDMRAEIAVAEYLGKQTIPVIINECIVRTFYFVSRLINEYQQHKKWSQINWHNTIPWGNRTITRMITISSGTFTAVDLADAAIRSALKNGTPQNPKFWADFVLRINIVGIGRFSIAVVDDIRMGVKHGRLRDERIALMSQQIHLYNAKVFYRQYDMWEEAETATQMVDELYVNSQKVMVAAVAMMNNTLNNATQISSYLPEIENKNPGLLDTIESILDN